MYEYIVKTADWSPFKTVHDLTTFTAVGWQNSLQARPQDFFRGGPDIFFRGGPSFFRGGPHHYQKSCYGIALKALSWSLLRP